MGGILKLVYCETLCRVSSSQIGNDAMSEQCQVLRLSWHQRSYCSFGCFITVSTIGTQLFPALLVCPPLLQWLLVAWCSRSWELNALLSLCHGKQSLPPVPLSLLRSAPGATITQLHYREGSVPVSHCEIMSGLLASILLSDIQLDPKCRLDGWLKHQLKMIACLKAP